MDNPDESFKENDNCSNSAELNEEECPKCKPVKVKPILNPDEIEELKKKAFPAAVKDYVHTLSDILDRVPVGIWVKWRNKGGRSLMGMAHERNALLAHSLLSNALATSPEDASDPILVSKLYMAIFDARACSTADVARLKELNTLLAEIPPEVWSIWQNECGHSLLFASRDTDEKCEFSDCRFRNVPEGGDAFHGYGVRHTMMRYSARQILEEKLVLAKQKVGAAADSKKFQVTKELIVRLLSGEEVLVKVLPETSIKKDIRAAVTAVKPPGKGYSPRLLWGGKVLDDGADESLAFWWMNWNDFHHSDGVFCEDQL